MTKTFDPVDRVAPAVANATLARAEQVVDLLRTCYIREGWQIDNAAAERALVYFRKSAQGDEDDELFQEAIKFLGSHGQSLDWVLDGNVGCMICTLAVHSERAESIEADNAKSEEASTAPIPSLKERMLKANIRLVRGGEQ